MKEKNYEVKRIYYLLLGIKESIVHKEYSVPQKVTNQFNNYINELETIINENLQGYKIDYSERYNDDSYNPYKFLFQLNQILTYLENMHINS